MVLNASIRTRVTFTPGATVIVPLMEPVPDVAAWAGVTTATIATTRNSALRLRRARRTENNKHTVSPK